MLTQCNLLVIVPEQVLVLFRAGTTSLRSGLGTFFVPVSDRADHTVCKADKKTIQQAID